MLSVWKKLVRKTLGGLALGLMLTGSGDAKAQNPTEIQELKARLEALERQNQELMRSLRQGGTITPVSESPLDAKQVEKLVGDYLKAEDGKKKAEADQKKKQVELEGTVVGSDFSMKPYWDNGLWVATEDKAFKVHVGGRTQFDTVFYNAPDNVMYGNNGVGRVDDGVAFRRARLAVEGTLWEVIDFNMEYDFLNTDTLAQNVNLNLTRNAAGAVTNVTPVRQGRVIDTPVPTDLWVQFTHLPGVGNVRVGNLKPPISFEHMTSSRFLNFMERSYGFDAYVGGPDNGFTPGIQVFRNFADDRIHASAALTRFNETIFGFNTGDGEWAATARIGGFPVWKHDGRCAVWMGLGYQHVDPDFLVQSNRQFAEKTNGQVRLRARTLLRNGPAELQTPLLDIFPVADSRNLLIPEFAMVWGPWTVQAEYFAHWLENARSTPTSASVGTHFTQSAYVEALYFLTGEHRVFNRTLPGFTRVTPNENFYLVNGDRGKLFGRGAWQVGLRYSYIDLDDKALIAGNNIRGQAQSLTAGLNWFLNPNMKIQWNYTYERRYGVNTVAGANAGLFPNQSSDGDLHGFGMRMAIDF